MSDFEIGPIRPPSEVRSLPVRVTRNCPWNRCKFCHFFKGRKFELRPLEQIKQDILVVKAIQDKFLCHYLKFWYGKTGEADICKFTNTPIEVVNNVTRWLDAGGRSAFLQDANTLIMPPDDLVQVIQFLKATLPVVTRVTTYGSSKTAARRTVAELTRLRKAGLSRVHIGLESGYDPLLAFMEKGATAADHIKGGQNVVSSGISLCVYVVLGLGGVKMWREHAVESARVINEINPEYIRLRTLSITEDMLLHREMLSGSFQRLSDEQIIEEEKLFVQNLDCHSNLVSDSITNLLYEVEGRLPEDKDRILATIEKFQSLSRIERDIFKVGRRLGMYNCLDDLGDPDQSETVERIMLQLGKYDESGIEEKVVEQLMTRLI